MRILHVILTGGLFGSERYCADLAARQAAMGHDVHVALSPRAKLKPLLASNVAVHQVGRFLRRWRLQALAARVKADIVHLHLSAACKAFGGMATRPPAVASLHVGYKAKQHRKLDGVIALTDADAALIAGYGGQVTRIRNWAPRSPDPGPDARARIRRELNLAADTYMVGFVGRLHPSKDPATLIRAFRAAALDNAALVMAGEGPARQTLEQLATGDARIRLLGYRGDAPALYRAFDHFVLPSRFEAAPLASLEAMSAGLPVTISNIANLVEFVAAPPANVFPLGDAGVLAEILKREHARGQRRETWDMTPFDPERQVAAVLVFYDRVIAATRR